MNNATKALACLLVAAPACATVPPRPLALPPRGAPLEERVASYGERAALPHATMFGGWRLRIGRDELRDVGVARPILANAPEAEAILHARDNRLVLGWTLYGAGVVTMLTSLVVLPSSLESSRPGVFPVLPFVLLGAGAAVALVGGFTAGSAQLTIPDAAEAYNHWLWNELDLPLRGPGGTVLGATPHPAPTPPPWEGR